MIDNISVTQNVSIPLKLRRELRSKAYETGKSISQLVREALREKFDREIRAKGEGRMPDENGGIE